MKGKENKPAAEGKAKRSGSGGSTASGNAKLPKPDKIITKVVVRHLPPSMTQEKFLEQVAPLPANNYFYFARADRTLGKHAFGRAYINFVEYSDLMIFKEKFDGYVFLDNRGHEYPASVEFSPSYKLPRRHLVTKVDPVLTNTIFSGKRMTAKKRDSKSGTVESDENYQQFLLDQEAAKKAAGGMPSLEAYLEEIEARDRAARERKGKVLTPLLEHILQRRANRQREREERRQRNHARRFNQTSAEPTFEPGMVKVIARPRGENEKQHHQHQHQQKPKSSASKQRSDQAPAGKDKESRTPKSARHKEKKDRGSDRKKQEKKEPATPDKEHKETRDRERQAPKERIKNKDRPAMEIYRPGTRKPSSKDTPDEAKPGTSDGKDKPSRTKVFSRSRKTGSDGKATKTPSADPAASAASKPKK